MFGAGVWPVVQRELRSTARWRLGPWLRMGAALGALLVYWGISFTVPESFVGVQVIFIIHVFLLAMIWIASPVAGLRPTRASRFLTSRVPSPLIRMREPF